MKRFKTSLITCLLLVMMLVSLAFFPITSHAVIDPVLPPRPTPGPAETTPSPSVVGATITLNIPAADNDTMSADNWAIVQWQDHNDKWNDVDGWQGNLAYDSSSASWEVVWWVARSNFGEKSFRWVIYSDESKTKQVATSVTFDLPENNLQGVVVTLE
jgi:hypothetical protein